MTANQATPLSLQGLSILITRPQRQAERLARAIENAGGHGIVFPTIEIQPITDDRGLRAIIGRLHDFQMAIFVSANAVEYAAPLIVTNDLKNAIPRFAAIGKATRAALLEYGIDNVLTPTEHYDSEGLLDLADMQNVAGKSIVIFRGEGGREKLAETLRNRGAMVEYAACYQRVRPQQDIGALSKRWQAGNIHAISAMSLESLTNLYDILDASTRRLLTTTPVFVPHPRIAKGAQALGLSKICVTGASDDDLIKELSRTQCRIP